MKLNRAESLIVNNPSRVWQQKLEIGCMRKYAPLPPGGTYFLEELYPTLYQNFITKHILLHPARNRFGGEELKTALDAANFSIQSLFELKLFGILAVVVKTS